jgi:tripartite ATP-independent transporter DctP family solute receptor
MNKKFLSLLLVLSMFVTLLIIPSIAENKPIVLRFGYLSPQNPEDPYHEFAVKYKEAIEEKTNGRFQIDLYGAGILGKDREMAEMLQFGALDLAIITTSPMGNFVPAYQVLDLPFLFDSWEHVFKFMDSPIYQEFLKESDNINIKTLGIIARGPRSVTNNGKPIESVDDLKGMKLRVIESKVFVDTFEALGAAPQAMSWGEVFTALQQGTIDGHENSIATILNERVYEVQKNVALTQHIFAFCSVHASSKFWNSLSEEDKAIFDSLATEIAREVSEGQQIIESNYIELLKEKGLTFTEVDRAPMKKMTAPVIENFIKSNPSLSKYVEGIEAAR